MKANEVVKVLGEVVELEVLTPRETEAVNIAKSFCSANSDALDEAMGEEEGMSEEEIKEVVDTLAGEYPPPRCPNCKEALDSLYSREPSLEWDNKIGKFVEINYFGGSPELCCPNRWIRSLYLRSIIINRLAGHSGLA